MTLCIGGATVLPRRFLLLSLLFVVSIGVSVHAHTNITANPMLDQIKNVADFLGVKLPSDALLPSLETLEQKVFGRVMEGTLLQRIDRVQTFVFGHGSEASLLYNLNVIEWMVYGEIQPGNVVERMYRLERDLLGQSNDGSLAERSAVLLGAVMPTGVLPVAKVTITDNVAIPFSVMQRVTSNAAAGTVQVVPARVAEDVIVDGVLVIPKGTRFDLQLTYLQAANRAGIPAQASLSPRNLYTISGQRLYIEMSEYITGADRTASTVGASLLGAVALGPVGLLGGLLIEGAKIEINVDDVFTAHLTSEHVVYGYPLVGPSQQ